MDITSSPSVLDAMNDIHGSRSLKGACRGSRSQSGSIARASAASFPFPHPARTPDAAMRDRTPRDRPPLSGSLPRPICLRRPYISPCPPSSVPLPALLCPPPHPSRPSHPYPYQRRRVLPLFAAPPHHGHQVPPPPHRTHHARALTVPLALHHRIQRQRARSYLRLLLQTPLSPARAARPRPPPSTDVPVDITPPRYARPPCACTAP